MFKLFIGNKNYSSWSLRAWLLMQHFQIPFVEQPVVVSGTGASDMHRAYADNGLVPCLHVDGFQIWDTLAIAEFLAEEFPQLNLWPQDRLMRARARSISAEMHAGFSNLRSQCGMNIKLRLQGAALSDAVQADISRISKAWADARAMPGSDTGPYLFGQFSIADAMYAPVVWRFFSYNIALPTVAAQYVQTMLAHPAMQEWERAALKETSVIRHYDDDALARFGGSR